MVDLLPTVCGLLGIDKPGGVHLDGSDLSPLLTNRKKAFKRHQPLFWLLPTSNPAMAVRDGNFSMVAYRDYELPRDRDAMNKVLQQIESILKKEHPEVLARGDFRNQVYNTKFPSPDAERLRIKFLHLNQFQEAWIPTIKTGGYKRFELFDLFFSYRYVKYLVVGNALFDGDSPFSGLIQFKLIYGPIADRAFNAACG